MNCQPGIIGGGQLGLIPVRGAGLWECRSVSWRAADAVACNAPTSGVGDLDSALALDRYWPPAMSYSLRQGGCADAALLPDQEFLPGGGCHDTTRQPLLMLRKTRRGKDWLQRRRPRPCLPHTVSGKAGPGS